MKRLTGFILCLLLVFTLFPAAAFAEGATELQISSGADFTAAIDQINSPGGGGVVKAPLSSGSPMTLPSPAVSP